MSDLEARIEALEVCGMCVCLWLSCGVTVVMSRFAAQAQSALVASLQQAVAALTERVAALEGANGLLHMSSVNLT